MPREQDAGIDALVKQLAENGANDTASALSGLFDLARRIEDERDHAPKDFAEPADRLDFFHEHAPAKGAPPADDPLSARFTATAERSEPLRSHFLEHGRRSSRALMLALAEMYLKGVANPDAEDVMADLGIGNLSNIQTSRAAILLDDELRAWCNRPLNVISYLILGARYEKVRDRGVVHDAVVLYAIGIGPDQRRRILGFSCSLSETTLYWEAFLERLRERGMRDVQFLVSDNHTGLRIAREAALPDIPWQRCQHHLVRRAMHYAPNVTIRKRLSHELKEIWDASNRQDATDKLQRLVADYIGYAPTLARWLNDNIPEGLEVFSLPKSHRRFMRSSNSMDRTVQLAIKKCSQKVRIFPSKESLERLVGAILVEIDETWATADQAYIKWDEEPC